MGRDKKMQGLDENLENLELNLNKLKEKSKEIKEEEKCPPCEVAVAAGITLSYCDLGDKKCTDLRENFENCQITLKDIFEKTKFSKRQKEVYDFFLNELPKGSIDKTLCELDEELE